MKSTNPAFYSLSPALVLFLTGFVYSIGLCADDSKNPASATPATSPATQPHYTYLKRSAPDGIGKVYLGREIAQVMGHTGADWLDRPEREQEEAPRKAIEMMQLKPTDVVADIGAGSGYFSFLMAERVPRGKVIAQDIQQEMLDLVTKRAREKGVKNVETVLGTVTDPKLPDNSIDVVLFVDSYHEFDHPFEMMTAIVKALKPGGRIVQLEYIAEREDVPIKPHHKMTEAQAKKEMEAVGLKFVENRKGLPRQHMLIFEKPAK
jgi:ubiquinone/menaquinone biosynthesis C-methylase UbiE